MALYLSKNKDNILRTAIQKIENDTQLTAVGSGSVLRAIVEAVTEEIGSLFDVMDYNISQTVVSTATGRALDLIGELYSVKRKVITNASLTQRSAGAFYFYLDSPSGVDITIPSGTQVQTGITVSSGAQFKYETTTNAVIPAGELYAYTDLRPLFSDSVFTAGAGSLTLHNYVDPNGTPIFCNNAKAIAAQLGYESDGNYRLRIIKAIRVASSGTSEAVRFKALSYDGVRDARIIERPFGMGSFQLIIIPEVSISGPSLVRKITPEIEKVVPVGTTMLVKLPEILLFDIGVNLTISSTVDIQLRNAIVSKVKSGIEKYLNSLMPGEVLVYNQLIALISSISTKITDFQITSYAANGSEVNRKNYIPSADVQIAPALITVRS